MALTRFIVNIIFCIMLFSRNKQVRTSWLCLAAVPLVLLYISQIVPHDHSESQHADHHSEHHHSQIPDTHHSRPHNHDPKDESDQPLPVHHHDLAQHVDSHFFRAQSPKLDISPEFTVLFAQFPPIVENKPLRVKWRDFDAWVSKIIPISPLDSRAPPLRG